MLCQLQLFLTLFFPSTLNLLETSGISVDPTNDKFFWVFNQYASVRGRPTGNGEDGQWATAWARAKFYGKRGTPPSPVAPSCEDNVKKNVCEKAGVCKWDKHDKKCYDDPVAMGAGYLRGDNAGDAHVAP